MQRLRYAIVVWEDAASEHGWYDPSESEERGTAVTLTVGLIVKENRREITISSTLNQMGHVEDPISIPKSCVLTIKRIKIQLPDISKWL